MALGVLAGEHGYPSLRPAGNTAPRRLQRLRGSLRQLTKGCRLYHATIVRRDGDDPGGEDHTLSQGGTIGRFLIALWGHDRVGAAVGLALLLLVGLSEGIGLMMLVPLLQLFGFSGATDTGLVGRLVAEAFSVTGIPLTLPAVLSVFVALVAMRALLVRIREVRLADLRLGFIEALRARLFRAMAAADWLFVARNRGSDLGAVLTVEALRVNQATMACLALLADLVVAAVFTGIAMSMSPSITLLALVSGAALALLLSFYTRRARHQGFELTGSNRAMFATIAEFLGGLKMVKCCAAETRHVEEFTTRIEAVRERQLEVVRTNSGIRMAYEIGAVVMLCVFVYVAHRLEVTATVLLLMILVFARLLPLFARIQQNVLQFYNALSGFASLGQATARCEEAAEPPAAEGISPLPFRKTLQLQSVVFSYGADRPEPVIRDLDLTIRAGDTTAIIGPSGAGKSTIADLLMGLLTPDEGAVLVDGQPLAGDRIHRWRRAVGYIPQDAVLFDGSVRANLLWPDGSFSDRELWECLRLAAVAEFVRETPRGLDTEVGERGLSLSGGERQRLALARALLRRPALLLLDEATSAIDLENERQVHRALEGLRGDVTVVIIAHRLSSLRHCDRIVVVQDGRIREAAAAGAASVGEIPGFQWPVANLDNL